VMIALGVLLNKGQERNSEIDSFIEAAIADENEELAGEAKRIGN